MKLHYFFFFTMTSLAGIVLTPIVLGQHFGWSQFSVHTLIVILLFLWFALMFKVQRDPSEKETGNGN